MEKNVPLQNDVSSFPPSSAWRSTHYIASKLLSSYARFVNCFLSCAICSELGFLQQISQFLNFGMWSPMCVVHAFIDKLNILSFFFIFVVCRLAILTRNLGKKMDVQVFKRASQYEPDTEAAQKYAAFTPLSNFYQKKSSNVYVDNGLCGCVRWELCASKYENELFFDTCNKLLYFEKNHARIQLCLWFIHCLFFSFLNTTFYNVHFT